MTLYYRLYTFSKKDAPPPPVNYCKPKSTEGKKTYVFVTTVATWRWLVLATKFCFGTECEDIFLYIHIFYLNWKFWSFKMQVPTICWTRKSRNKHYKKCFISNIGFVLTLLYFSQKKTTITIEPSSRLKNFLITSWEPATAEHNLGVSSLPTLHTTNSQSADPGLEWPYQEKSTHWLLPGFEFFLLKKTFHCLGSHRWYFSFS